MKDKAINRRNFLTTGAAGAVILLPGILRSETRPTELMQGGAFGTTWRIELPADVTDIPALRASIENCLTQIDRQMSPWKPESVLSKLNHAPAGRYLVPEETALVTTAALEIAQASQGAFDPTVGPAVSRWGFGPIEGDSGNWTELNVENGRIDRPRAGLTLDLCGIAKGRALDRVSDVLSARKLNDYIIEIGGELRAAGRHPSGRAWMAGIETPSQLASGLAGTLPLNNRAIATSGNAQNSYRIGDHLYSHIIDPGSRRPVDSGRLASVSVIADTAMEADGWATALMAAGPERGPALAAQNGCDAVFLFADGAAITHRIIGNVPFTRIAT